MELNPLELSQPDRYKLLIGCIVPRPIALVSTLSTDNQPNLAPFSFFTGIGSDPMLVLFCPANNADGSEKDSLRNAKPASEGGRGEFVISAATHAIARQVAACAEPLPHGQSEFDLADLHTTPSKFVKPHRVKESPVAFECVTQQVIRTNPGVAAGGNIVIGRVVHVYIDDALINDRYHTDPAKLDAIGRMGGLGYIRIGPPDHRFDMPMGIRAIKPGA